VNSPCVEIQAGYRAGLIGRAVEMHGRYYSRHAGFGRGFESQVAAGLAEFAARLDDPRNEIWAAIQSGTVVGTVTIDGEDIGPERAHLRWFIVDDGARDSGIGRRLLETALAFCDRQGFAETHLWTFQGLHSARKLYEANGFTLAEERHGRQWGEEVLEQRFVRQAGA
jgi:GNAT superfamily N-acetyltransferase